MPESNASTPSSDGGQVTPAVARLVADSIGELVGAIAGSVGPDTVAAVAAAVEPVHLAPGERLFRVGDRPDAAYFVVTGRLLISVADGEEERVIRRVGRGQVIGEIGLIDGEARTASVTADRDSVLARLPAAAFEQVAADHPDFMAGLSRIVVHRLTKPRPPVDTVGVVAVAGGSGALTATELAERMTRVMGELGDSVAVTGDALVAELGDGVVTATPGSEEWLRLTDHLDGVEARHRFVVLDAAGEEEWLENAVRHADRVLLVVDGESGDEAARGAAAATSAGRPVWLVAVRPAGSGRPSGSADMVARFGAERVLHVEADVEADLDRVARVAFGMGVGLAFGGGGARGFMHLGAYRALRELGVPIDAVAGTSIGGALGALVADGLAPDAAVAEARSRFKKVLDWTLPLVSMVKGKRIARAITGFIGDADLRDLPIPFLCISTNFTEGTKVIHDSGSAARAVRAGLAIPGVIPPVPHDGDLLVDGGVLDNLPVDALRATGLVGTVIAVDVAPPRGSRARDDFGLSVSGWAALRSKFGRNRRRYPGLSGLLMRSMIIGSMQERDRLLAAGYADLYLDLDARGVSMLAFNEVDSVADRGYELARPRIEEWLAARASGTD
jgi:predicted acylesterase/phospholipase RssA